MRLKVTRLAVMIAAVGLLEGCFSDNEKKTQAPILGYDLKPLIKKSEDTKIISVVSKPLNYQNFDKLKEKCAKPHNFILDDNYKFKFIKIPKGTGVDCSYTKDFELHSLTNSGREMRYPYIFDFKIIVGDIYLTRIYTSNYKIEGVKTYLAVETEEQGVKFASYKNFISTYIVDSEYRKIIAGPLKGDQEINGIEFMGGKRIQFWRDTEDIKSGYLANDTTIEGSVFKKGSFLAFDRYSGEPIPQDEKCYNMTSGACTDTLRSYKNE